MGQNADFAAVTTWRGVRNKPDFFPTNLDNIAQSGATDQQVVTWDAAAKKWVPANSPATVSVEVGDTTTGAPGTDAEVTNVGTPTEVVLDFVIPEGEPGADGAPGTPGAPGAPGTDGATWYSGSGVPSGGLGANGDFYLRLGVTGNGDVYEKASGAWSVVGNIEGPAGPSSAPVGPRVRSDLRALTGMVDLQFTLEAGYGFEGDGGGGFWQFIAADNYSTDNDGTLVVPGGVYGDPATAGCWHRGGPGTQGASVLPSTTLDVRWFGALPNDADCSVGLNHAFAALNIPGAKQLGTLLFCAGEFKIENKVVFNCRPGGTNLALTLQGNGAGATNIMYGLTAADTCMLEILQADGGGIQDIGFSTGGFTIVNSPSVVWVHSCTNFTLQNVSGKNLVSTAVNGAPGGVFRFGGPTGTYAGENTLLKLVNVSTFGNSNAGSMVYWENGSGMMMNCNFKTGTTARPCFYMVGCNSFQSVNVFTEGGGPWMRHLEATITSTVSDFTVNMTAHGFLAGDYIRLSAYANAGYNKVWKIATVPGANSLTVTSTANLGSDTGTLESLWSSAYFGPTSGKVVTESQINSWFCNTGGGPTYGSIGMFLDAWQNGSIGQFSVSDSLTDYGYSSIFCHGRMNSDPGGNSSCGGIRIINQRQNTGTQTEFGGARIEGCKDVTITDFNQFPGDNNPPGTGKTFTAIVISDGGQAWETQTISITGGVLTNPHSTALYPAATIIAVQLDGVNLKNVKINRPMMDTAVTVLSLINGATMTNGNSMIYDNNASQEVLINAAGTTTR